MAVEFKQNANPTLCIKNMISDLDKVSKIRKSEINLRSIWSVGITQNIDSIKLNEIIESNLDEKIYQAKSKSKHIQLKKIGETKFYYIIM